MLGILGLGLTLLILAIWTLGDFEHAYRDVTKVALHRTYEIGIPQGDYIGVAWLDDSQIALLYVPAEEGSIWNRQIMLYSLDTKQWNLLEIPRPTECMLGSPQFIRRLPDGNLGFIYRCLVDLDHGGVSENVYSLYIWNAQTSDLRILERYPANFRAGPFAFAPTMSEIIQERVVGNGLNNELYRVVLRQSMDQMFTTWQRVAAPSWSPDGNRIAFVGTETYTSKTPLHPLFGLGQTLDLLYYPWDIYVMSADGNKVSTALKGIRNAVLDNWSPNDKIIIFTGIYDGKEGTWLLDTETSQVTRIWPYETASDWSPNGQQLILIQRTHSQSPNNAGLVIINVSELEQ